MRKILSTGDAKKDAELIAQALGTTNRNTREQDEAKFKAANEEQATQTKNAFVEQPHAEGHVLLVLPDEDEPEQPKAKKEETVALPPLQKSENLK